MTLKCVLHINDMYAVVFVALSPFCLALVYRLDDLYNRK